ncbi:MAG TPA: sigma-70 family RNA polymerase sigma factor [Chloroflexota bacterium]|nr:sigma-70 family RNA polymerase sigma factor [Chloroflexota bacterium]
MDQGLTPDRELIDLARRGDHAAYGEIVERYKDAGYRAALNILREPADAEDALQEAFVRAYVHLNSYKPEFRFYTWFSTIVRNVALSHLRARDWLVTPLTDDMIRPARALIQESPELVALAATRAEIIRDAVNLLPDRYRRVLILRYWHDLTYEEIARVTEQSLGAVKTQIHRAKLMLADAASMGSLGLALE